MHSILYYFSHSLNKLVCGNQKLSIVILAVVKISLHPIKEYGN